MFQSLLRKCSVLALTAVLLLSMSGCEKKPDPVDENPEATTRVERKQIVFYNLFDPEDTLRGQIQAYESANRDIDIVYKKFHDVQEYEELVLNELAEARGPAIFAIRNDWLDNYQRKIQPAPASVFLPEKFADTFLAVATDDLVRPDEEGFSRVWGLPLYIDTLAIYYNKQLFRDNLPSTNKPAATWNELKEQTYALTKADKSIERFSISGIAMGLATNISHFADILSLLFVQESVRLFDESEERAVFSRSQGVNPGTGQSSYPAVEALQLYTGFALPSSRHVSWNLPITGLYPNQKEIGVFARGKTAMIFGFSSMYNEIKIAIDGFARSNEPTIQLENVGIAPVPQFTEFQENGRQDAFAKYYPLVVSRHTEYGEEAWRFLEFLASPDSLRTYHEKTNKPTSRLDMIEEQSVEQAFGVFARQAAYAKSLRTLAPEEFFAILADVVSEVTQGRLSVEQGVQRAETQMSCVLQKRKNPGLDEDCFELQ